MFDKLGIFVKPEDVDSGPPGLRRTVGLEPFGCLAFEDPTGAVQTHNGVI